jgi:N,N'-diacetyllegionaminate synthase
MNNALCGIMKKIYNILEVANTHGGHIDYILDLLDEFEEFNKNNGFGIKFQPFKYNQIATEDFEWYKVYKELYIDESAWTKIFDKAYDTKDIWIDVFDLYGVSIIQKNLDIIYGLKLQTSILDNQEVYNALQAIDISKLKLIINIAGRGKEDINDIINRYEVLHAEELLLEVGFQAYPTDLVDSGLSKIKYLKDNYNYRVVFADHIDGGNQDAVTLPLIASMLGADFIEKHIMHSTIEAKYDGFSSVKYDTYKKIIENQNNFLPLMDSVFISDAEAKYLDDSYQVPILKIQKEQSSIVNLDTDFIFRRSGLDGLNSKQIKSLVSNFNVLKTSHEANTTLKKEDFRKANIAAIIACRLKSSRLPKKAILKIGDLTSIELCIKNTLKIKNLNNVILATSDNKQDMQLSKYIYDDSVIFHQGDAKDVVSRYLDVINKLEIDVFLRITGDMPYVSSEISEYLLKKHFESGADYTVASKYTVGTDVEIINTAALKKIQKYFPNADYSEYMTWYFQNNPDYFDLNFVDLPREWVRDYRLTLDYQEDLDVFNRIEKYFKDNNIDFNIKELYKFLDNNPKVSEINSHISLAYKTDNELIKELNKQTKINEDIAE